jgi:acyl CoA:acetate/3-ketoacid CoA transferase alpha subunit
MTTADAIKKAVTDGDSYLAGKWVDRMRAMGASNESIASRANKLTGISADCLADLLAGDDRIFIVKAEG